MIQRVQTIYLLIISIIMIVALFQPVWKNKGFFIAQNKEGFLTLDPFKISFIPTSGAGSPVSEEVGNPAPLTPEGGTLSVNDNVYIAGLLIVSALLSIYTIFLYKKRLLQVKLCSLNYLLMSGTLLAYYLAIKNANPLLSEAGDGDFLFGFYAPIVAILFNFLAIRFIRKDEALVRSVDRLR